MTIQELLSRKPSEKLYLQFSESTLISNIQLGIFPSTLNPKFFQESRNFQKEKKALGKERVNLWQEMLKLDGQKLKLKEELDKTKNTFGEDSDEFKLQSSLIFQISQSYNDKFTKFDQVDNDLSNLYSNSIKTFKKEYEEYYSQLSLSEQLIEKTSKQTILLAQINNSKDQTRITEYHSQLDQVNSEIQTMAQQIKLNEQHESEVLMGEVD